jgi:hypothetical protein
VLSTPKKLIVLGYSLPATDLHAQYIFPVRLSQPDRGSAEERRNAETFSLLGNPGPARGESSRHPARGREGEPGAP